MVAREGFRRGLHAAVSTLGVIVLAATLLLGCVSEAEKRCHAMGGIYMSVYKSRDICLRREAVLEYDE